jgi:ATP-dependent Lon protease
MASNVTEDLLSNADPSKRQRVAAPKRTASKRIVNPAYRYYDNEERKHYDELSEEERIVIAAMETKIKQMNDEDVPIRFKVLTLNMDEKIKAIAIKQLGYLFDLDPASSEYYKLKNWVDNLCKIPIGKYVQLPVSKASSVGEIRSFLHSVKSKLDDTVYGHVDAKHAIQCLLAQWISNPVSKGLVIGIQGAMGCGKTSLIKNGVCEALGLPFAFVSLGGASDASYLDGHSYTYEGSTWGKIVSILMQSKCMNPVIYFDELDKVSSTYKGEEIINNLIHLTDSSQNDKYSDKYFVGVDFDLSRCLLIFSYNDEAAISPILRDRMVRIKTDGYTIDDKSEIAKRYLVRELSAQFKFKDGNVSFSNAIIRYMINNKVAEEKGVRNLKRAIEAVMSNVNLNALMTPESVVFPIEVDESMVDKYVKNTDGDLSSKAMSMYL